MNKNTRTKNSKEDVEKFIDVRQGKIFSISKETRDLQIQQVQQVHKDFPKVRFYDFHKQAKNYWDRDFADCLDDCDCCYYRKASFLPDGYFFHWHGIFLIEIENHSRLTKERVGKVIDWYFQFDERIQTPIYLLEFNRFGKFQRKVWSEGDFYPLRNKREDKILKIMHNIPDKPNGWGEVFDEVE